MRTHITNFYRLLQKKVKVKSRIEIGVEPKLFVRKGLRLGLNWKRLSLRLGLGSELTLRLNSLFQRTGRPFLRQNKRRTLIDKNSQNSKIRRFYKFNLQTLNVVRRVRVVEQKNIQH